MCIAATRVHAHAHAAVTCLPASPTFQGCEETFCTAPAVSLRNLRVSASTSSSSASSASSMIAFMAFTCSDIEQQCIIPWPLPKDCMECTFPTKGARKKPLPPNGSHGSHFSPSP